MKIWTKVLLKDKNKDIEVISNALTNYLYKYGPISDVLKKYGISYEDKKEIDQYTVNRIAGIITLYLANDKERINDIINKYYTKDFIVKNITPELEGYINVKRDS